MIGCFSELPGLGRAHQLKPQEKSDSALNLYSGNFGLGDYPMHTDMAHWTNPPRFMALRCVRGAPVSTLVVGVKKALGTLSQSTIMRATFKPRKRSGGRLTLLPFAREDDGGQLYRWDKLFLKPANASAEEVAAQLSNAGATAQSFVLGATGDTLIIDNWQTLHGRGPVPDSARGRIIERAYLDLISA